LRLAEKKYAAKFPEAGNCLPVAAPVTERHSLQVRGDFFNILNHPNFGSPINFLSSPQFAQATQMLANYLETAGQSGGLNPSTKLAARGRSKWPSSCNFEFTMMLRPK